MPGNQIVATFQVNKNLVVTPSALAETFVCRIPSNDIQENPSEPPRKQKKFQDTSHVNKISRNQVFVYNKFDLPSYTLLPNVPVTMQFKLNPESRLGKKSLVKLIPYEIAELKCSKHSEVDGKKIFQSEIINTSECKLVFQNGDTIATKSTLKAL